MIKFENILASEWCHLLVSALVVIVFKKYFMCNTTAFISVIFLGILWEALTYIFGYTKFISATDLIMDLIGCIAGIII